MQFIDPEFGLCKVLYQKRDLSENVCLFAGFTFFPQIPEYVYYYLSDIRKAGFSIVFISSSPIDKQDLEKLQSLADIVIEKENLGTDFGAWCSIIRWLDYGKKFSNLYLCNDSVFGPFIPFTTIHEKFLLMDEEVMGLTDSYQVAHHIQSYFIGFKKNVLLSDAWEIFWRSMIFHSEKRKVIDHYEVGLTQMVLNAGFKCFIWTEWTDKITYNRILHKASTSKILQERWINRVLYEKKNIIYDINPSSFIWRELVSECQHPFIKRELFLFENLFEECEIENNWEKIVRGQTPYPINLIKINLIQHFLFKYWKTAPNKEDLFTISIINANTSEANKIFSQKCNAFVAIQRVFSVEIYKRNDFYSFTEKLANLNIEYLPLLLTDKYERKAACVLLYLDEEIVNYKDEEIIEIKTVLKDNTYSIVIVPDSASKIIVSSLLVLKPEAVLNEEELYNPQLSNKLVERLKSFWGFFFSDGLLQKYQRPSLQDIINDAINRTSITNFLQPISNQAIIEQKTVSTNEVIVNHAEKEYEEYITMREKYTILYENTPYWYKFFGQLIKLFSGHKKFALIIKDKNLKEHYKPTAEDMAHWYYLQYEILPAWYKRIGNNLANKKRKS